MLKKATLALFAVASITAAPASAGQFDSGAFTVQATIAGTCTAVTPTSLNFGTLLGTAANVDSTTNISVTCANGLPYNLTINYGLAGLTAARAMKNGTNVLSYQLFTDSARLVNFGDTTAGSAFWIGGTGSGVAQPLAVYARVPAQPSPLAGTYSDTLVASVIW